jgi:hypothetical protein
VGIWISRKNGSKAMSFDENLFSDLHKDAFGFRPRGHEFYEATDARKQAIWDETCEALDFELVRECRFALDSQREWEAKLAKFIELGAADEATAIRWDMEANNIRADDPHLSINEIVERSGYYCYLSGIDYMHEYRVAAAFS